MICACAVSAFSRYPEYSGSLEALDVRLVSFPVPASALFVF